MSSWKQVNKELIAKAIGEMVFEENISVSEENDFFSFATSQGVTYRFQGQKSIWGWIKVDAESITRNGESDILASQYFIDTQSITQMSDTTLAQFIEESRSSLFADLHLNHEVKAKDFIKLNFLESQQLLNGHPKILINKGRLGWSVEDWKSYAPETAPVFPLKLIAIKKNISRGIIPPPELYRTLVSERRLAAISEEVNLNDYVLMPVHPWQWNNVIFYHYQNEIQNREIIDLDTTSFHFSPQTSLRTLNCMEDLKAHEVKLPLSVLNTSCIRGIPAKTIEVGVRVSKALKELIHNDPFLKDRVDILAELAGINYIPKDLAQIKAAPYRFHEFLGVIWRESAFSKVTDNENIILTANLLFVDNHKASSIGAYIEASGLSPEEWIRLYTKTVVIPLFHLQAQHGVGLVSHGQNIMLILENYRPKKLILKDFQGDFRLSTKAPQETNELFSEVIYDVIKLPPEHLIHDLYTAHFVTLLRYVGMNLQQEGILSENKFYEIMSEEIALYEKEFKPSITLVKPYFEKILINTVRYKIGYGDSAERPLPLLGNTISNPLYQARL